MLSQAVRPSAQAAACAACARQARRTAASLSSSSSRHHLSPSYRSAAPSGRSTSVAVQRRGQASFAQVGEQVREDDLERGKEGEETTAMDREKTAEPAAQVERKAEEAEAQSAAGTEAVKEEEVPAQRQEDEPPSSSAAEQEEEAVKPTQALLDLLHSIQPEPVAEQDSPPSATPAKSSSSSSPSASASNPTDPNEIPPVPSIPITLPNQPRSPRGQNLPLSHPQLDDLFALRPKRVRIPTADSPDSHRLVYHRDWSAAHKRLTTAFTKSQLLRLAGPEGLEIDVNKPIMRTATPGRKTRGWKSKRLEQMSKGELAQAVLVGEFGLVHPDTVALSAKTGPQASETITLSNRTLFLLLSPNSPTIPNIARKLGVKTSFRRDPSTGLIQLLLKGNQQSVDAAKEEVSLVDELKTVEHDTLPLPCSPTVLRPEVYQSISRQTKVFLEPFTWSASSTTTTTPAAPEHSLSASAITPRSLLSASRLLHSAFSSYLTSLSTPLAASLPTSDSSPTSLALGLATKYSMSPIQPLVAPEPVRSGAATAWGRVKALSKAAAPPPSPLGAMLAGRPLAGEGAEMPPPGMEGEELQKWMEKMRFSRSSAERTRIGLTAPTAFSKSAYGASEASLWDLLKAPFVGGEAQEGKKVQVQVKARFGFVGWPLYPPQPSVAGGKAKRSKKEKEKEQQQEKGLGPVLAGQWPFEKFREWVGFREKKGVRGVFVASPPPNLLASTGVLTPLPPSPSSPSAFTSLFPSFSTPSPSSFSDAPSDSSSPLTPEQLSSLSTTPSLLSTSLRRWVYRPVLHSLPAEELAAALRGEGRALESLVVDSVVEGEGRGGEKVSKREIRMEKEGRVDVMVPTCAVDAQFSVTQTEVLDEADYPEGITLDYGRNAPPVTLTHRGVSYMLDTDRRIRRTVLTPPSPSPSSSSSSSSSDTPPPPFEQVQESWTSLWPVTPGKPDGARGVDVYLAVTPLSDGGGEGGGMALEEVKKSGLWRRAVEEVEGRCAGRKKEEEK